VHGASHPELRIDGYLGGVKVASRRFSADPAADRLLLAADDTELIGDGTDATRVVFRAVDAYGAPRPYAGGWVQLTVHGPPCWSAATRSASPPPEPPTWPGYGRCPARQARYGTGQPPGAQVGHGNDPHPAALIRERQSTCYGNDGAGSSPNASSRTFDHSPSAPMSRSRPILKVLTVGPGVGSTSCQDASPRPWVDGQKVGHMGDGLSATGPGSMPGAANGESKTVIPDHEPVTRPRLGDAADEAATETPGHEPATQRRLGSTADETRAETPGHEPVTRPRLGDAAGLPSHPPTEVPSQPAGAPVAPLVAAVPGDVVRYGPGVSAAPAASAGLTAERIWRDGPPPKRRRRSRVLQFLGYALTVILLAASGVLFYLRFHHTPLHVTRITIVHSGSAACSVNVTGQISTNGGAGTVTYQWLFPIGPPRRLQQSVSAGQSVVHVQLNLNGVGHGVASQRISLQVLSPDQGIVSQDVLVSCP
jgi:hypothetical protein